MPIFTFPGRLKWYFLKLYMLEKFEGNFSTDRFWHLQNVGCFQPIRNHDVFKEDINVISAILPVEDEISDLICAVS